MARTTIRASDLLVDRPLDWCVYDPDGTLVYARGSVIDSETKARLLRRGVVRDVDAEVGRLMASSADGGAAINAEQNRGVRIALTDTAVRPGDTVHIDRSLDGSRITARFIGYFKGKSIIINVPADDMGAVFLKEGEAVVARVFSGKHVLAFPCVVLTTTSKPFPHIHLSYPNDVTGVVVRRTERASVRLIAAIDVGRDQVSGIITDLSSGGLSFVSRAAGLAAGVELELSFKLPLADCPYLMKLSGMVRAVRPGQSDVLDGATAYGLQFHDLAAEDALIVSLFVSQQLAVARTAGA